ncbi:MAG: hypothetical protein H6748_14245 [Spirochaetaceae bacterium]|nr:hypothetical protein [Myxococcales bacterium]MCB9725208.1 hypothetical protein [Spirochaetaceae bacterium]
MLAAGGARAEEAPSEPPPPTDAHVELGPTKGLVFRSGAGRLDLHVFTWQRAETDTRISGETDVAASIPLARLVLQGHFFDDRLLFFFQPEVAGSRPDELLDLFAEWKVDERLRVRIGQFRTPFSRAYITPLSNIELTGRGLVSDQFRLGRDTGAMFSGAFADGLFHYDLGIFNGAGINDLSGNRDAPLLVARTELRFGDVIPYDQAPSLVLDDPHGVTLAFGGAFSRPGIVQGAGAAQTTTSEQLGHATAEIAWMHGPLSVHAEGFWRSAQGSPRPPNAFGSFVQAGVFVVPRRVEIGGRAGWLSNGHDVESYEGFLASYWKFGDTWLGHHFKTVLEYRYDSGDPSGVDLRDRHRVTLQNQIFF